MLLLLNFVAFCLLEQLINFRFFSYSQGPLSAVCLLSSNAEDMVKWIKFNLRSGCLEDGRQLIRRDIWMEMWHHQIDLSPMFLKAVDKSSTNWPVRDISEGYGLFWFLNKYRGRHWATRYFSISTYAGGDGRWCTLKTWCVKWASAKQLHLNSLCRIKQ